MSTYQNGKLNKEEAVDITAAFTDSIFLENVYAAIGKTAPEPIYASDVAGITSLDVDNESLWVKNLECFDGGKCTKDIDCCDGRTCRYGIECLNGIEHFKALTSLDCRWNALVELPKLPPSLESLDCSSNFIKTLPKLPDGLIFLDCGYNEITKLPELPS